MYVLYIVVCPFVLFLLAIVLSVFLRFTDSDYPFGIFKLFSLKISNTCFGTVVYKAQTVKRFLFVVDQSLLVECPYVESLSERDKPQD